MGYSDIAYLRDLLVEGDIDEQEYEELVYLVNLYKNAKCEPNQVAGNDTVEGYYFPIYRFNRYNRFSI